MTTARGALVDARECGDARDRMASRANLENPQRSSEAARANDGEGDEERAVGRFISGHIQ